MQARQDKELQNSLKCEYRRCRVKKSHFAILIRCAPDSNPAARF
jgi:hypothetical protein